MHTVGFIIIIYHDARSPECQIRANIHGIFAGGKKSKRKIQNYMGH